MSMIVKNRIKSSWTPLANDEANNKIYEERVGLIGKWFERWSDGQKVKFFETLVMKSKPRHLESARDLIRDRVPRPRDDFTKCLPRVLSIYLFSFLDPRSLSRCAKVCWNWKSLVELDQLWIPKCVRFGWCLSFSPSPYETGVWKRNYLEHIRSLRVMRPKINDPTLDDLVNMKLKNGKPDNNKKEKKKKETPWKGTDPVPTDTWRYNVLPNDDAVDSVSKFRRKKMHSRESVEINRKAKSKVNCGQDNLFHDLRRSKSNPGLMDGSRTISYSDRPNWAREVIESQDVSKTMNIPRPEPVIHKPKPTKPTTARSARDPPTARLFPEQPWRIPKDAELEDY